MTAQSSNRQPSHRLYLVRGDGDHSRWIELGAAWPNRDGNGFSIQLDAIPSDGRLVMRVAQEGGQS